VTNSVIYTDRSRYLESQRCLRARWLGYELGRDESKGIAGGITKAALSIPLSTGTYVHVGVTDLLLDAMIRPVTTDVIDSAALCAVNLYRTEATARGLDIDTPSDVQETIAEQSALIEALIRAWALNRLPALLSEYEVLEVEAEKVLPLTGSLESHNSYVESRSAIQFQSRADALLRTRTDGSLVVYSLKTAATWDDRKAREVLHDVQGLSEPAGVEYELGRNRDVLVHEIWEQSGHVAGLLVLREFSDVDDQWEKLKSLRQQYQHAPVAVSSVLMDFLMKGERRSEDDGSGTDTKKWFQASHLVRAWRRLGAAIGTCPACNSGHAVVRIDDPISGAEWKCENCGHAGTAVEFNEVGTYEYAWSYYWRCSAPHPMRKSKWYPNGQCDGLGKRHKLGDDWQSFNVWTDYPGSVAQWIADLAARRVQPDAGDPFQSVHIVPMPLYRQAQEMDDWKEQIAASEARIAEDAERIRRLEDPENVRRELNRCFPMSRRACDYPVSCQFTEICHGIHAGDGLMAVESGQFVWRSAHHEPEAEQFAAAESESA